MSKKTKWQVEVKKGPGAAETGLVFVRARRNSRGPWTVDGALLPRYVYDYLLLYQNDARTDVPDDSLLYVADVHDFDVIRNQPDIAVQRSNDPNVLKFVAAIPEPTPASRSETFKEYTVDLKWSCWSTDESIWEYAPEAYKAIQEALAGKGEPIVVHSGPRKEIHYMTVYIVPRGGNKCVIDVQCTHCWDDWHDLEDTLNLPEGTMDDPSTTEYLPHTSDGEPGVTVEASFVSGGKRAMEKIDAVDNEAMVESERAWTSLKDVWAPEMRTIVEHVRAQQAGA
jgi:hypothetical protein